MLKVALHKIFLQLMKLMKGKNKFCRDKAILVVITDAKSAIGIKMPSLSNEI